MTFRKVGDAVVAKILCGCGQELKGRLDKCPKCGKTLIPDNLKEEKPKEKEESKVK
jgi:hypothetical protein